MAQLESRQNQAPRKRPAPRTAWKKGESGNPGGRPKELGHVRELARAHTEEALATLVEIMRNGETDRARAAAAEVLLDRAWGRAAQPLEHRTETLSLDQESVELIQKAMRGPGVIDLETSEFAYALGSPHRDGNGEGEGSPDDAAILDDQERS